MKTLLLAALLCAGCTINVDRPLPSDAAYWNMPDSQPWVVDPVPQPGSGMGFMCREAINRGDSGAVNVFCR